MSKKPTMAAYRAAQLKSVTSRSTQHVVVQAKQWLWRYLCLSVVLFGAILLRVSSHAQDYKAELESLCSPQPTYEQLSVMTMSELVDQYCSYEGGPDCNDAQALVLHMLKVGYGLGQPICGKPRIDPVRNLTVEICGPWQLHGYRIGTSQEEAFPVREIKKKRRGFETIAFDGFKGLLEFDRFGLALYRGQVNKKHATPEFTQELEDALRAHLGQPFISNLDASGERLAKNVLLWKSYDCNAIIGLETGADRKGRARVKHVFLQRLSLFKANLRKSARK